MGRVLMVVGVAAIIVVIVSNPKLMQDLLGILADLVNALKSL